MLKINFDGAMFQNEGGANIQVIIRDEKGLAIAHLSQNMALPQSAAEIEALAVMKALTFSQDLGNLEAILEGELGYV